MNIECEKEKMIFRNENNGKVFYSIGLSKKNQDGKYTSGYITCRFPKNANIENKTKIKILNAWLDFWVDDKKITHPYIFINKYEMILDGIPKNIKSERSDEGIQLNDEEIDKVFNGENEVELTLPF